MSLIICYYKITSSVNLQERLTVRFHEFDITCKTEVRLQSRKDHHFIRRSMEGVTSIILESAGNLAPIYVKAEFRKETNKTRCEFEENINFCHTTRS